MSRKKSQISSLSKLFPLFVFNLQPICLKEKALHSSKRLISWWEPTEMGSATCYSFIRSEWSWLCPSFGFWFLVFVLVFVFDTQSQVWLFPCEFLPSLLLNNCCVLLYPKLYLVLDSEMDRDTRDLIILIIKGKVFCSLSWVPWRFFNCQY